MTTSTVNLSFRYSESDYVRALRAHYAAKMRLRLDLVVLAVAFVAGVYLWQSPSSRWLSISVLSVSGIFGLILIAAFVVIPPLVFRREPKFKDEYSLAFGEQGIHFSTAHIDSQLQWSLYSRALIDRHSYVLYYGERSFTVIPRRVFHNTEQQRAFEQLLAVHISKIDTKV